MQSAESGARAGDDSEFDDGSFFLDGLGHDDVARDWVYCAGDLLEAEKKRSENSERLREFIFSR